MLWRIPLFLTALHPSTPPAKYRYNHKSQSCLPPPFGRITNATNRSLISDCDNINSHTLHSISNFSLSSIPIWIVWSFVGWHQWRLLLVLYYHQAVMCRYPPTLVRIVHIRYVMSYHKHNLTLVRVYSWNVIWRWKPSIGIFVGKITKISRKNI